MWLADPVTAALRQWARGQREERRQMWEDGDFTGATQFETHVKYATALGACSVYREVSEMELETILGDQTDE